MTRIARIGHRQHPRTPPSSAQITRSACRIHRFSRAAWLAAAALSAWLSFPCSPVLGGEKDICVRISEVYRGRNCGTSDSVQVDVRNSCGMRVAGVVIFNQESGDPIRVPLVLDREASQVVFACHGNGKVDRDFDVDRQSRE